MTSFLALRRTGALLPPSLVLLAATSLACGGAEGTQLFGTGGASSGDGGGSASSGTASTSSGTGAAGSSSTGTASSTSSSSSTTSSSSTGGAGCQPGYVCVDPDPPGGGGYYYVNVKQLPAGMAAPCPANLDPFTYFASPAGPAQCTSCTCGPIEGAICAPPQITCWDGSTTCMGGAGTDWTNALKDGTCQTPASLLGTATQLSCKITAAAMLQNPGACMPSEVSFPNQSPWGTRIDACGTNQSAGSCGTGQVCIPQGSGAANESLCVLFDGTATCPTGWTKTIAGFAHETDDRACTDCACGDGATCGDSHYTFYDTATCTSASTGGAINVGANASSQCTNVSADVSQSMWSAKATLPQVHGSCPASGGKPTGMVTPENPITYCCQ